jgi:predicted transposase YbfD/YdcC
MLDLSGFFAGVPDPRAANARHELSEILLIAFAATLGGAESCVDMAAFAAAKQEALGELLVLKHGIPSHDTFSRVFKLLEPTAFEAVFRGFMAEFAAALSRKPGKAQPVLAIDGKSLRGAVDAASRTTPLHLVTAWAADQRLVLSQRRAPNRSEVTAAREIIALLDLAGAIVTADALHCSRKTAAAIRERKGDYALVIKGNRGPLYDEARVLLADADPQDEAATTEKAHGRYEERRAVVAPVPQDWPERFGFPGLAAIARIDSLRQIGETEQRQSRYVALSCLMEPAEALRVVRTHWSIENRQHWLLDVAFAEDRIHTRNDNAAENLALLRRLALNLIRADLDKASIRLKIKRAGWDTAYLMKLISQMR